MASGSGVPPGCGHLRAQLGADLPLSSLLGLLASGPLCLRSLSIDRSQHDTSQASPQESEKVSKREVAIFFCDLILEVRTHHFCGHFPEVTKAASTLGGAEHQEARIARAIWLAAHRPVKGLLSAVFQLNDWGHPTA